MFAQVIQGKTSNPQALDAALNRFYGGRDDAFWKRPGTWGK
jgi:hypothetical protein